MTRSAVATAAFLACAFPALAAAATQLSITTGSVVEPDGIDTARLQFFVTRSGDLTNPVNFGLFTVNPSGTATSGVDYEAIPFGTRFVIPANSSFSVHFVTVNGDQRVIELNEHFTVALNSAFEVDGAARTLAPVREIVVPAGAAHAVIADFDGDTRPDIGWSDATSLTILRNLAGEGTDFSPSGNLALTGQAGALVAADFNGDGLPDLAATLPATDQVVIFRNRSVPGTIAFGGAVVKASVGMPTALAAGDYDNDGLIDLVAANRNAATVSLLRNQSSSGQIAFANAAAEAAGTNPVDVALADLDGDDLPDLVTLTLAGTDALVRRNTCCGGAPFAAAQPFALPAAASAVAAGDIDGDALADLVATSPSLDQAVVLLNTSTSGSVSFAGQQAFGAGDAPDDVVVSDVDGDGLPEIVTSNLAAGAVQVLPNDSSAGAPAFLAAVPHDTGTNPLNVSAGDVNGDGFADIVTVNDEPAIGILRNQGTDVELTVPTFDALIFNDDANPPDELGAMAPLALLGLTGLLLLRSSRRRNRAS